LSKVMNLEFAKHSSMRNWSPNRRARPCATRCAWWWTLPTCTGSVRSSTRCKRNCGVRDPIRLGIVEVHRHIKTILWKLREYFYAPANRKWAAGTHHQHGSKTAL